MFFKIFKSRIKREKTINIIIFIFIALSTFFVVSGVKIFFDLSSVSENLTKISDSPHLIQYHTGNIDQNIVDEWVNRQEEISKHENQKLINIGVENIYINSYRSESGNVMEMLFVEQNKKFDFFVNLSGEIFQLKDGEIAVPVFFMKKRNLKIGDEIFIKNRNAVIKFKITQFLRDNQLNSSLLGAKRFVVSKNDFGKIEKNFGIRQYFIAFQFNDKKMMKDFIIKYRKSQMPQRGMMIESEYTEIINMLNFGFISIVQVLIGFLLVVIVGICLKYIILSTIEEDLKDVGIMKAIGFTQKDITKVYMIKYLVMSSVAAILGLLLSFLFIKIIEKDIILYFGEPKLEIKSLIFSIISGVGVFLLIVLFSSITINKSSKISAIEAIRLGNTGETYRANNFMTLSRSNWMNLNVLFAIRELFIRIKEFIFLFVLFTIISFVVTITINLVTTLESKQFVEYSGFGNNDIFIDLRNTDDVRERFERMIKNLKIDGDVDKIKNFVLCYYEIIDDNGNSKILPVIVGDFKDFDFDYIEGIHPVLNNEISLSALNSKEYKKNIGDTITLVKNGVQRKMIVTGIYQDMNHGGRTAHANIEINYTKSVWYTIYVLLKENKNVDMKVIEYANKDKKAQVIGVEEGVKELFGDTHEQFKNFIKIIEILSFSISFLITYLFSKMIIIKNSSQIIIMKGIGFSNRNLRIQIVVRLGLITLLGMSTGILAANVFDEKLLVSIFFKIGISKMKLITQPKEIYFIYPFFILISVTVASIIGSQNIKKLLISDIRVE